MLVPPQLMQKFTLKMRTCLEPPGITDITILEKTARATKNSTALTFLDITFFSLRLPILVPPNSTDKPCSASSRNACGSAISI